MKQIVLTIVLATFFVACASGDNPITPPDLTQIRIKENPGETLKYVGRIGSDFDTALDSLRKLKSIPSEIIKEPLEVLFDYDDRLFFGITYGDCGMYSDVLDTKGFYYLRSWYSSDEDNAQKEFYYYQGKKIPLTLNENKVCVSIPKTCNKTSESIQANVKVLTTIEDNTFDIFVITRSDYEKLSSLDSWGEDAKSVILTSAYFTEDNEEVYSTPYLNIKLKKEEDKDLLTSYAEKYRLRIHSQNAFMPLWYILSVTLDSEKSPMECANELFESGDFAASVADLAAANIMLNDQTFIQHITTSKIEGPSKIYDLHGRQLNVVPEHGLYIQGGKKTFCK